MSQKTYLRQYYLIYKSIADKECVRSVKDNVERGDMGWGQLKHYLENLLDEKFSHYGQKYDEYISSPEYVEDILLDGAKKLEL